nr:alpha/beta hydrolase [uncultured Brevundimonas sp.]
MTGDGPDCLLVHGFGEGGYDWRDVSSDLARSMRVVVPDLRGHGLSEWTGDGTYRLKDYVADIEHVLDATCGTGVILVGHSLGAAIVLEIAARRTDSVAGLILLDHSPEPDRFVVDWVYNNFAAAAAETYDSPESYAERLLQTRPMLSPTAAYQLSLAALVRDEDGRYGIRNDPAIVKDRRPPIPSDALLAWEYIRKVRSPTLVLRGQASAVLSASMARRIVAELPQGELVTIPAAGHALLWENSEATVAATGSFIRRLTSVR